MTSGAATFVRRSGTIDSDLLRERVGLFLKVMFAIDLGFYGISWTLRLAGLVPDLGEIDPSSIAFRWSITALLFGSWLYATRGKPGTAGLIGIESVGTKALAALYAFLAASMPDATPWLTLSLVTIVLVLRASIVPSPLGRTVAVGLGAMLISLGVSWRAMSGVPPLDFLGVGIMGLATVVVTAVTSKVIYGLRREVSSARRLGQYELGRKLGAGAMGEVYEAKHVLLRRPTALKLLPIDKVGERTVARFEQEVQQTSRLEHPNSVNVYDYGRTDDGQFYYAMEYVDGLRLDELVTLSGPLPPGRVVSILRQAARALAEAHAKGLVHRDVKPSNIMICNRGLVPDTVKVLDFGLVKAVDGGADAKLTLENTVVGTPHFLAPEAINAPDEVGPAADVYALGAVGYFLLTGQDVFEGNTIIEVCSKHLNVEPTPPSERLDTPLDDTLEQLILRCLAKAPEERHASGRALAAALDALPIPAWTESQAAAWWAEQAPPSSQNSAEKQRLTVAIAQGAYA